MIKKKQNQASKKETDPTRAKHAPGRSGDSGPTPFSQFDLALTEYSHAAVLSLARRTKLTSRNVARACLQFGAAASAALVSGTGVEAAIVYSGPQDIKLTPPVSSASEAFIDLDADGQFDFRFYIYNSGNGPGSSSPLVYGRNAADLIAVTEPFMSAAKRFSFGEQIGTPGSSLGAANTYGSLLWRQNGFVGVQMTNGNFGWIQVTHDHIGADKGLTIHDWAYEDSGRHLTAGQTTSIPEPTTASGLGLLAMGAVGIRILRRRKRTDAADNRAEQPA